MVTRGEKNNSHESEVYLLELGRKLQKKRKHEQLLSTNESELPQEGE